MVRPLPAGPSTTLEPLKLYAPSLVTHSRVCTPPESSPLLLSRPGTPIAIFFPSLENERCVPYKSSLVVSANGLPICDQLEPSQEYTLTIPLLVLPT